MKKCEAISTFYPLSGRRQDMLEMLERYEKFIGSIDGFVECKITKDTDDEVVLVEIWASKKDIENFYNKHIPYSGFSLQALELSRCRPVYILKSE